MVDERCLGLGRPVVLICQRFFHRVPNVATTATVIVQGLLCSDGNIVYLSDFLSRTKSRSIRHALAIRSHRVQLDGNVSSALLRG